MSKRTITLTGRPPVSIDEDQWPEIARATDDRYDGEFRSQANRVTDYSVRVRQHADGRAIVYAVHDYSTRWQGERDLCVKRGVLLAESSPQSLCDTIREVCSDMESETGDQEWSRLSADCIADMPAEALE